MTSEGSNFSQTICILGLLPFLLIGIVWVLGCLRAIVYFFSWLRLQTLSTRWLTISLPLIPPLMLFLGACLKHRHDAFIECSTIFTLLSAIVITMTVIISGALHTYPVVEKIAMSLQQMKRWQKTLLIGLMLDLLLSRLMRG
ncbi:MAG: hypothetical protein QM758_26400 [Armatimonas sp.]